MQMKEQPLANQIVSQLGIRYIQVSNRLSLAEVQNEYMNKEPIREIKLNEELPIPQRSSQQHTSARVTFSPITLFEAFIFTIE